ncbi:MAG: ornithine carbamoyltransferase [Thermoleophilia bacterium]
MTKHFLEIEDLTAVEIRGILDLAHELKTSPLGTDLAGRSIALIFHKPSTRTRVSFSVGISQLGGYALSLAEQEIQMKSSESVEDTARVLSRYVDAVVIRTFAQADLAAYAAASSVPVVNGLTDERHPCQGLTDVFTFEEYFPDPRGRTITYLGDGNNVAFSLSAAAAKLGVNVVLSVPECCDLSAADMGILRRMHEEAGSRIVVERDPKKAVEEASALYTDVWVSMGQSGSEEKVRALRPYRVDLELLSRAPDKAIVMHCLPAHRGEEITDEVMDGPRSVVFDQAENRLHVQKALLIKLLAGAEERDC